jgi:hypothetical protein
MKSFKIKQKPEEKTFLNDIPAGIHLLNCSPDHLWTGMPERKN